MSYGLWDEKRPGSLLKTHNSHLICYTGRMQELYTKALVLDRRPVGEADELVTFYTEKFGKIYARAKSIRKITSKVSAHLQPLGFTQVRFIHRGNFTVLDAMAETRPRPQLISIVRLLADMTHEWEKDTRLWQYIQRIQIEDIPEKEMNRDVLALLGFDGRHASCAFCKKEQAYAFLKTRNDFVCRACASKVSESEVVCI